MIQDAEEKGLIKPGEVSPTKSSSFSGLGFGHVTWTHCMTDIFTFDLLFFLSCFSIYVRVTVV